MVGVIVGHQLSNLVSLPAPKEKISTTSLNYRADISLSTNGPIEIMAIARNEMKIYKKKIWADTNSALPPIYPDNYCREKQD
jgi:hypothetical protein